jgi:hypothetical protein
LRLDVNRREFLKITAGAGAVLAVPTSGHTTVSSKMIGIQVGAVSFVDEGTEKVLDVLQALASVNTLFLAVFTYGRGIAGRQIPGQPLPDHGDLDILAEVLPAAKKRGMKVICWLEDVFRIDLPNIEKLEAGCQKTCALIRSLSA